MIFCYLFFIIVLLFLLLFLLFFFNDPPPTEIYTLSLHDALPISQTPRARRAQARSRRLPPRQQRALAVLVQRSEEHTSELQSRGHLVCRLLLEKKKKKKNTKQTQ